MSFFWGGKQKNFKQVQVKKNIWLIKGDFFEKIRSIKKCFIFFGWLVKNLYPVSYPIPLKEAYTE